MKKVSIIIPIYNTREFLSDCLQSIVNQTYKELEIILIDDYSQDGSQEIMELFSKQDKRISCVYLHERKGVGYARNAGLDRITGDYAYFVDSDDYLMSDTIEKLVNHIDDHMWITGMQKRIDAKIDFQEIERTVKIEVVDNLPRQFKNMSALHLLLAVEYIQTHDLRFAEDVECYTDLAFLVPAMLHLESIPALTDCYYFKRVRNDPISNPSINQLSREKKAEAFLPLFIQLQERYKHHALASKYLDRQFLNFYRKTMIMLFMDEQKIPLYFKKLTECMDHVNPEAISKLNAGIKLELKLLLNRRQNQFTKLIQVHHLARSVKGAIGGRQKTYIQLYRHLFLKQPLKERTIVFESFLGKNYSDSPKYIYEYMVNQKMNYKYVWVFKETGKKLPGKAKQVKRFSLAYYRYLATSKYWVSNSRMPLSLNKRKDNVYLQTWHGTPLKKLVFDMDDIYSANPKYKQHFYYQSRRWDYLLSPNAYSSEIFQRAFKFDKEMLEVGYPRNDILYTQNNAGCINTIKDKLRIPKGKKVILYAPTWRDDEYYEPGKYKFQLQLDLKRLREELGKEYVIALRMHYFIADVLDIEGNEDFVFNFSTYDDIAELYLIADLLITDYSSVFFDYANLKRPILFFTYDLEKYRDTLRGFYIDMEKELPGPLLTNTEEIISSIVEIEQVTKDYHNRYDTFYKKFCNWEEGKSAEKVVKAIFPE